MMANLSKQITGLKRLDVEGRTLLREGAVCLMTPKKKCQLLLFNDIIVFATEQTNRDRVLSFSANKQVGIELLMDLRTVWLEDLFDLDPQTSTHRKCMCVCSDLCVCVSFPLKQTMMHLSCTILNDRTLCTVAQRTKRDSGQSTLATMFVG